MEHNETNTQSRNILLQEIESLREEAGDFEDSYLRTRERNKKLRGQLLTMERIQAEHVQALLARIEMLTGGE